MKWLLIVVLLFLGSVPAVAQSNTPQPLPLPTQQMYEALATANANTGNLPTDLTRPGGVPILPNEDGRRMFGYVKWILSPAAADEWAGPFAPVFQHFGVGLGIVFSLMGVYGVMYVIGNAGGWVGWLLENARKMIDLFLQGVQAAPVLLVLVVLVFVAYLLFGSEGVQNWIDQQLDGVIDWVYQIISQITGGA